MGIVFGRLGRAEKISFCPSLFKTTNIRPHPGRRGDSRHSDPPRQRMRSHVRTFTGLVSATRQIFAYTEPEAAMRISAQATA